jgi:tetrahydromethanopterin S-methyltransferase subunit E
LLPAFNSELLNSFLLGLGAGKIVSTPRKVDYLADVRVKMVALGSDHSIAVTGECVKYSRYGSWNITAFKCLKFSCHFPLKRKVKP